MSRKFRSASSRSARFSRAYPVATGLIILTAVFTTTVAMIAIFWSQLDHLHLPPVLAISIGWFVAVGSMLGIALLLMWVNDQREVNRSRRAIRLNFDHALMAMLELAHHFTEDADRNLIGATIESAQKQIIAASARLKRYENRLTSFPPEALNAYADLENEIDVALDELNDLHRKLRSDRARMAKFGFDVLDRVGRFDEFLTVIDGRPTQASVAFERFTPAPAAAPPAAAVPEENAVAIRRA